jgi:putative hydrolase of HD superfamily
MRADARRPDETEEEKAAGVANFLFEAASLKRTPRSGYQFLGRGRETVAEHVFGATVMAYALGRLSGRADVGRLTLLTLFHDLAEARTGDLNYVNKRYVTSREDSAFRAMAAGLPFEADLLSLREEWEAGESLEARLAADADQLDMMLELRRLAARGWTQADEWLHYAEKRLKTDEARRLAAKLLLADPDDWWFERRDELWVDPAPPADPIKSDSPPETATPPKSRKAFARHERSTYGPGTDRRSSRRTSRGEKS